VVTKEVRARIRKRRERLTSEARGAAETLAEVVRKAARVRKRVSALMNMAFECVRVKRV
jgi:hypothetical protein